MVKLHDEDRAAIDAAIATAEERLAVDIHALSVPASCRYTGWVTICALVTALLVGVIGLFILPWLTPPRLMFLELAVLVISSLLYEIPWVKLLIVPNRVEKHAVWRQARLHYAGIKLRAQSDQPLLLLYCSHAERYAEILVDERISECVPEEVWQDILTGFKPHMRRRDIGAAFVHVIEESENALAPYFSRQ